MVFEKTLKKTCFINLRVTSDEKTVIEDLAVRRNMNISEYLLYLVAKDYQGRDSRGRMLPQDQKS